MHFKCMLLSVFVYIFLNMCILHVFLNVCVLSVFLSVHFKIFKCLNVLFKCMCIFGVCLMYFCVHFKVFKHQFWLWAHFLQSLFQPSLQPESLSKMQV